MLFRLFGDDHDTRHRRDAVGMLLKGRVPEILRIVLLACRKMNIARAAILGESERETDLHRRSVRPFCFALETQRVRRANAGARERPRHRAAHLSIQE